MPTEKVLWRALTGKREVLAVSQRLDSCPRHCLAYSARQKLLGRPLSPSLTVYKQSIPALSSITNRVCGVALALSFGAAATAASAGKDLPSLIHKAQDTIPGFSSVSRFAIAFPFVYHWLAGTRHVVRCRRINSQKVDSLTASRNLVSRFGTKHRSSST